MQRRFIGNTEMPLGNWFCFFPGPCLSSPGMQQGPEQRQNEGAESREYTAGASNEEEAQIPYLFICTSGAEHG